MDIKSTNRINIDPQIGENQPDIQPQKEAEKPGGISFIPDVLQPASEEASFLPGAGDEVLVQFQPGEVRNPFVTGDLWKADEPPEFEALKAEIGKEKPDLARISTSLEALKTVSARLDEDITSWEDKLNSIGDDAQLANVDLQNILQKQQQALQMMSNISKMLFDSVAAIIRKLGE